MTDTEIAPAGPATPESVGQQLDMAGRVFQQATGRQRGAPPDLLSFSAQLQFLLTIGYLTTEQARALLTWFTSNGTVKLPALASPPGSPTPSMYEILSTRIHFGTPRPVRDQSGGASSDRPSGGDVALESDIGDFFSALASAVGDLIGSVTDGITEVLNAGTQLLQAGAELVHEVHDLVVLSE